MNCYLVERYLPGVSEGELRRALVRLQEACEELSSRGIQVRYVGSMFIEEEETCFCRLDGEDPAAVADANERAGLPLARITAGLTLLPAGAGDPADGCAGGMSGVT